MLYTGHSCRSIAAVAVYPVPTPCLCWWMAGLVWMGAVRSQRVTRCMMPGYADASSSSRALSASAAVSDVSTVAASTIMATTSPAPMAQAR